MTPHARQVAPLLFASGLCALVYQVAWLREFRLIFGASTAASAAVLAIFIGGLGLGGLLLGPRADRRASPLGFYARLEAGIAVTVALSPGLLWLVRQVYQALGSIRPRSGCSLPPKQALQNGFERLIFQKYWSCGT